MIASILSRVEGVRLSLRLVMPDDATYIHGLRTDPAYNSHLSAVTGTVEGQRGWIETYKTREAARTEYYFVIERTDGVRCGVVRLYDIKSDEFTWGSWILDENKPSKAALESAVLIYRYGFEVLGFDKAVFDVRRENERTLAFHRRFGAIETGRDETNFHFEYTIKKFAADRLAHMAVVHFEEQQ
jgi:RimJ/RimL family protein N-acetyltransferase